MITAADGHSRRPSKALRSVGSAIPRAVTRVRREPPPERVSLAGLVLLAVLATIGGSELSEALFPPVLMSVPLLFGGLLLVRRALRWLVVVVVLCLLWDLFVLGLETFRVGSLVVVLVTGLVGYEFSRSREETGLTGLRGDTLLVELRSRLELQGVLPELDGPWRGEAVVKPAGGGPFSGDFVVSALTDDRHLEVALVDVSGKGVDAGTRSLMLSGALGGLLGAKQPHDFLPAANAYLMRQDWEEGFATAVHLVLDLDDGSFGIASAGHPPAAHFDAGSGRWSLLDAHGPALGLLHEAVYVGSTGCLRPGDALLLYTDGLVEVSGRDLSLGIDKLIGEAERLVTRGFAGGGEVLVNRVSEGSSDDRGLVLLWRTS